MIILSFDACMPIGSVSLLDLNGVMASSSWRTPRKHASRIIVEIEKLLAISGKKMEDIDLFISTAGPGSFTGVRISLSVAKAFSFKSRVGTVSTLEAAAAGLLSSGLKVLSVMKAMRGKVYALCMTESKRIFGPVDVTVEELVLKLKRGDELLICGNALEDDYVRKMLKDYGKILKPYVFPLSTGAGIYAMNYGYNEEIEPIYVRSHDARKPVD